MAASLKDAMKKAYATQGLEPPSKKQKKPKNSSWKDQVMVSYGTVETHSRNKMEREKLPNNRNSHTGHDLAAILAGIKARESKSATLSPPVQPKTSTNKTEPPDCEIKVKNGIRLTCLIEDDRQQHSYCAPAKAGIKEQAHAGTWQDEREVVIGLDFGTSSVKTIIADRALAKAFSVPFSTTEGIGRYLLPSRLFETDGTYLLVDGDITHRDLKLSLLADPDDTEAQIRVAAFLALIIRHSRGWLLSEHRDVYRQTNILWKLAVGLPAAHHLHSEHHALFQQVAQAAWLVAASSKLEITRESVGYALSRAEQLVTGSPPSRPAEEAEISVVPELAAQIYGYVASNRFNRNAPNLYLMVDVGAGTVDSSLFRVEHSTGGKKKFTFFTSQVQPNGVMNLHRHRINWWEKVLSKLGPSNVPNTACLMNSKLSTDRLSSIPERFIDYFSGVAVTHRASVQDPDQEFFHKRVVVQVRGNTLWQTWRDKFLSRNDLSGVPMFLCGGGTRMQYYRDLEQEMSKMPGYSWLKAEARPLEVPKSLIAPGLPRQDYDRLSVAFGLSFLEVSAVLKATPLPPILPDEVASWRDNYTDKDQC
jgi:hypothetical protein